jgi:hypothetical protein
VDKINNAIEVNNNVSGIIKLLIPIIKLELKNKEKIVKLKIMNANDLK